MNENVPEKRCAVWPKNVMADPMLWAVRTNVAVTGTEIAASIWVIVTPTPAPFVLTVVAPPLSVPVIVSAVPFCPKVRIVGVSGWDGKGGRRQQSQE